MEARAIPFITQQASGALAIEAEAATFLRSVEPPVCVLAVVGMHRTGKSFLMNSLLLSQSQQSEGCVRGFKVGNGLNTCTKGVWIYNQVVQMTRSDGSLARFLVLDHSAIGGVSNAARERHRSQAAAHPAGEHVDVLVRGERYAGKRVEVF